MFSKLCFVITSIAVFVLMAHIKANVCNAQVISSKQVTILKNGSPVSRYEPLSCGPRDRIQVKIDIEIFNYIEKDIVVTAKMTTFNDKNGGGGSFHTQTLRPGRKINMSFEPSIGLPAEIKSEAYSFHWNFSYTIKTDNAEKIENSIPIPDGVGLVTFHKEPVDLKLVVAQTPEPVKHPSNWLEMGRAEILDAVYELRRRGEIRRDTSLFKALNESGTRYGQQLLEFKNALKKQSFAWDEFSLAMTVAKKRQYETVTKEMEPEFLIRAIELASRMQFSSGSPSMEPGDVSYLTNPAVVKLLDLTEQQQAKVLDLANQLAAERKSDNEEFVTTLKEFRIGKTESQTDSFIQRHEEEMDKRAQGTFESMLSVLSEQQGKLYEERVGLTRPFRYRFKK